MLRLSLGCCKMEISRNPKNTKAGIGLVNALWIHKRFYYFVLYVRKQFSFLAFRFFPHHVNCFLTFISIFPSSLCFVLYSRIFFDKMYYIKKVTINEEKSTPTFPRDNAFPFPGHESASYKL